MAISQNGWSENYLVGLLTPFYHNSGLVNKKFQRLVGGDFSDTKAEVLFTVRIVLRNSGASDSSIPKLILKFRMRVVNRRINSVILGSDFPTKSVARSRLVRNLGIHREKLLILRSFWPKI
jgi:hypothetical protein